MREDINELKNVVKFFSKSSKNNLNNDKTQKKAVNNNKIMQKLK